MLTGLLFAIGGSVSSGLNCVPRHFNFTDLDRCQRKFDRFRARYNFIRPHAAGFALLRGENQN